MDKSIIENINPLLTYVVVVDEGSFTAAARKLSTQTSTVMRSIDKLEHRLKVTLLTRTSKGVSTTQSGEAIYQQMKSLSSSLDNLTNCLDEKTDDKSNTISLAIPFGSATVFVDTVFKKYSINGPVKFNLTEYDFNLFKQPTEEVYRWASQFDVLVIPSSILKELPHICSNYILLDSFKNDYCLFSSTDYINENPVHSLNDLAKHNCLVINYDSNTAPGVPSSEWKFINTKDQSVEQVKLPSCQSYTNISTAFQALRYTGGIVLLPDMFLLGSQMNDDIKVVKIDGYQPEGSTINILFNKENSTPQKLRLVKEFISQLDGEPVKSIEALRKINYGNFIAKPCQQPQTRTRTEKHLETA